MKHTPSENVVYKGKRYLKGIEYDVPADFPVAKKVKKTKKVITNDDYKG